MAKTRKIRQRVKAVRNIRTIARTMEMVASAHYRRSHEQATGSRPYTDRVTDLVGDLAARGGEGGMEHPLLHEHPELQRDVLIVLTSNRGLCGGYNNSVLQLAMQRRKQLLDADYEVRLHVAGRRGIQYMRFRELEIEKTYTAFGDVPAYDAVGRIAHELMQRFMDDEISGVEVAYMQYRSSSEQRPAIAQLLPMAYIEAPKRFTPMGAMNDVQYELVPDAQRILRNLLPATVRLRLWQCFLDASVSEAVQRMGAMRAATENADEMIRELSLAYNRIRQGQITRELAEIMGGRLGLE
jgi:F-type H+-transporting ATPase subunit gamma